MNEQQIAQILTLLAYGFCSTVPASVVRAAFQRVAENADAWEMLGRSQALLADPEMTAQYMRDFANAAMPVAKKHGLIEAEGDAA